MDITDARSFFPGTRDRVFLDAACVSLLPVQAEQALQRLTQDMLLCPARDASAHHIALDRTAEPPRREIARLIGANPDDIALVESTTHGLEILAAAVPLARGDKILVGDTEFLGLAVPWLPRHETDSIRIEVVPSRNGRLDAADFARAVDDRTRMILLSSVQWSSGFRVDLAAFGELARRHNLLLVVDAIQQLGALRIDVSRTPVDFLVCGGHKWLSCPAGRGFLYIRPDRLAELRPPATGYLHIAEPPEGWAEYFATPTIPAVRSCDFTQTARRFETGGTANYPGNVALGAAVGLINELGADAIERYVLDLAGQLMDGLRKAGAMIVSPTEDGERSSIVTFTLGEGPQRDRDFLHRLWERKIIVSQRYTAGVGGLRVSVHFYNNAEDIAQLIEAVRRR
jgi:selenocysteine lyase/cysteine desulfurase